MREWTWDASWCKEKKSVGVFIERRCTALYINCGSQMMTLNITKLSKVVCGDFDAGYDVLQTTRYSDRRSGVGYKAGTRMNT